MVAIVILQMIVMMQSSACKHAYRRTGIVINTIYIANINGGPRTVPCGTPDITLTSLRASPFSTTFCALWVGQLLIHSSTFIALSLISLIDITVHGK